MAWVLVFLKVFFHKQKILIFVNTNSVTQEMFAYPKVAKISPLFSPGSVILLAVSGLDPCPVSARKCPCGVGFIILGASLAVALLPAVKASLPRESLALLPMLRAGWPWGPVSLWSLPSAAGAASGGVRPPAGFCSCGLSGLSWGLRVSIVALSWTPRCLRHIRLDCDEDGIVW